MSGKLAAIRRRQGAYPVSDTAAFAIGAAPAYKTQPPNIPKHTAYFKQAVEAPKGDLPTALCAVQSLVQASRTPKEEKVKNKLYTFISRL